ncbi:outer membrane protein assembly factor BamE [Hahella sp. SMD15-11]|uniref:Outer membrane protein assembly factor BamE n=1 Tax=Thermohahella caldifontis TaxID=3142973 RepID=A0AB39UW95_9GAMM
MRNILIARLRSLTLLCTLSLGLTACAFPGVYRLDIQQGNIIEDKDLARVEPGMNRAQVHFVLGTPLSTDTFDPTLEDYIYTLQLGGGEIRRQHVQLVYTPDGTLQEIRKLALLPDEYRTLGKAYRARHKSDAPE